LAKTKTTESRRRTAQGATDATRADAESKVARSDAKQQTRAALVRAAARVFHEQGLDASLDDICAAAGYTRGAFYVHFKDREDLIAAVATETSKGRIESIIASGEGALDLERTIQAFAEAVRTGAFPGLGAVELHQFLAAVARSSAVRLQQQRVTSMAKGRLAQAVREGQIGGSIRKDVHPEAVAELLLSLVSGVEMMIVLGNPVDVVAASRDLLRMLRPPARTRG
jgi:AcrR family transcriptional regulator